MLTLAEELYLLALYDEKGYVIPSVKPLLGFGLTGAVLFELVLLDKIEVRKKKIVVLDTSSTNDEIFDMVLLKLSSSKKVQSITTWIWRLNTRQLSSSIIARLIARKILYKVDRKILKIIPDSRYPIRDGREKKVIRYQIQSVFLRNKTPDRHLRLLINLMHACDLTWELFSREEKKMVKKQIEEMVKQKDSNQSIEMIKKDMIGWINSTAISGD